MGPVLVNFGMLTELDRMTASWAGIRFAGLFINDLNPTRTTTIAQIEPANFSGYVGLRPLMGWTAAALLGERAVTRAAPITWTHDGGTLSNWINGYYVVDPSGNLVWVERRPGPAASMIHAGTVYEVVPQFSLGSRFPVTGG